MELLVGVGAGILVLFVFLYLLRRWRGRGRRFVGRWAARNGYTLRRGDRVHLFVQGPPFDRGVGTIERVLLVGGCADRPSLITHFSWHYGDPARPAGSSLAVVVELPGAVPPLQVDSLAALTGATVPAEPGPADFDATYLVTCDDPELTRLVVHPELVRYLLSGPHLERLSLRLDGTALIVWADGALTGPRQLSALHDRATEIYRLIPPSVYPEPEPVPAPRPPRAGERVHGQGAEACVSLAVDALWPELTITAYELLADQYRATTFDKPAPSAYPLVDIMFAVRSADEGFRRAVLDDLADWLPIDDRSRRCVIRLDHDPDADPDDPAGRVTAYAPGEVANTALVALLTEVANEVAGRLSPATYRYRPVRSSGQPQGQQA